MSGLDPNPVHLLWVPCVSFSPVYGENALSFASIPGPCIWGTVDEPQYMVVAS